MANSGRLAKASPSRSVTNNFTGSNVNSWGHGDWRFWQAIHQHIQLCFRLGDIALKIKLGASSNFAEFGVRAQNIALRSVAASAILSRLMDANCLSKSEFFRFNSSCL